MRISELQKFLAKVKRKHGDIEVLERRYSDYQTMDLPLWELVRAAPQQNGAYLMRDHHYSLTPEQRAKLDFRDYLLFDGN